MPATRIWSYAYAICPVEPSRPSAETPVVDLKRSGTTDVGTTGLTKAQLGADYRLSGKINSLDSRNTKSGLVQRYTQISFEMTDLESGEIVWSGIYEFSRAAADDVFGNVSCPRGCAAA